MELLKWLSSHKIKHPRKLHSHQYMNNATHRKTPAQQPDSPSSTLAVAGHLYPKASSPLPPLCLLQLLSQTSNERQMVYKTLTQLSLAINILQKQLNDDSQDIWVVLGVALLALAIYS